jgi:glycosyltransferase involved in cell wall biosynthesis
VQVDSGKSVSQRPTVCGVVLALNAADVIDGCLKSLAWTDQLIVLVDAATNDSTAVQAQTAGADVHYRAFTTFADQRNVALELSTTDWILFVDADERVTPSLSSEVREVVDQDPSVVGFWVPRKNIIRGRWIKHAGWYPDRQLRLLRRGYASYPTDLPVHEVAALQGAAGTLKQPLIHFNYRSLGDFWSRQRRYARIAAQGMVSRGEHPRARSIIGQPVREFTRRFFAQSGYKEGPLGLALSAMVAAGVLETYARAVLRRV